MALPFDFVLVQTTIWILVYCSLFFLKIVFVRGLMKVDLKLLYKQHKRDCKPLKPKVRTTLRYFVP